MHVEIFWVFLNLIKFDGGGGGGGGGCGGRGAGGGVYKWGDLNPLQTKVGVGGLFLFIKWR